MSSVKWKTIFTARLTHLVFLLLHSVLQIRQINNVEYSTHDWGRQGWKFNKLLTLNLNHENIFGSFQCFVWILYRIYEDFLLLHQSDFLDFLLLVLLLQMAFLHYSNSHHYTLVQHIAIIFTRFNQGIEVLTIRMKFLVKLQRTFRATFWRYHVGSNDLKCNP